MRARASRIRELREKTGKTQAEMAAALDMTDMSYFDLEFHDDELIDVPSIEQVRRLASLLGVSVASLVIEPGETGPSGRVPYSELVARLEAHLRNSGMSLTEFEDVVGWSLSEFMESERKALDFYNIDFLKSLSEALGVNYLEALP
jgi:DNA-binding XRE family transcriptional regulator